MIEFHIEPMGQGHLRQVHNIESECFSVPWTYESFVYELTNPLAIYIVAVSDGDVVGFLGMHHVVDEGHITNIAVREQNRRQGIGDALIRRMIDIAVAKDIVGLFLEVRMGNAEAQRLYGKHGFAFMGIRKNYYTDTKEDAIVMWKKIDPEGMAQ